MLETILFVIFHLCVLQHLFKGPEEPQSIIDNKQAFVIGCLIFFKSFVSLIQYLNINVSSLSPRFLRFQ